jgi:acetyltransferase-like isoleucine patch superfamily enzyme
MFKKLNNIAPGLLLSACVAIVAMFLSSLIPGDIIGATVMALLVGMAFNPILNRYKQFNAGVSYTGKIVLRIGIVLMGVNMNFSEVLNVGKYSLFVMIFTMATAFGAGNLIGKMFGMNWKLTNLLSVSTAICGGSAVAAVGPVIKAKDEDVAYAISSTFIFDILTVVVVYFNVNCILLDVCCITIGDYTLIGPGVHIYTATHPTSAVERRAGLEFGRPVAIGQDVWIGGGSIICPGTNIGDGTVVGAGSVVTRSLPASVLAAGNPCRVLRPL